MTKLVASLLPALLFACATPTDAPLVLHHEKSPSPIDRHIETATIEDYILAVPIHRLHEGDRKGFEAAVRNARSLPENRGLPADELYLPGDGSMGPHKFILDRNSRTLEVRVIGTGEEFPASTSLYKRVRSGWFVRTL